MADNRLKGWRLRVNGAGRRRAPGRRRVRLRGHARTLGRRWLRRAPPRADRRVEGVVGPRRRHDGVYPFFGKAFSGFAVPLPNQIYVQLHTTNRKYRIL